MSEAVLDASAVLALLNDEPGADIVAAVAGDALVSTVNLSEVLSKMIDEGGTYAQAAETLAALPCSAIVFDEELAKSAGRLRAATRRFGLSLGDRACLTLAEATGLPALTADRSWGRLDVGIPVRLIR